MTFHIGYVHGSKLEPFLPPRFCQGGAGLQEYIYYYQKGYRQVTGELYQVEQEPQQKLQLTELAA